MFMTRFFDVILFHTYLQVHIIFLSLYYYIARKIMHNKRPVKMLRPVKSVKTGSIPIYSLSSCLHLIITLLQSYKKKIKLKESP
jgi:hypothetical protein